ncbi:MAG: sigma-70 family RNA polymerase sigma factor [Acidobacteria bacterium]|nr:sigma-70 family RNA polymerase sigma factor [Acidobacteriota bacterium]
MPPLRELVQRARNGSLTACGEIVEATRAAAYAVAAGVLRDRASAEDAVQEAYLRAFRRLDDLEHPDAFAGWLRRIVVTVAMNARRGRRATLLRLDDVPEIPVLDEAETVWSEVQRQRLAAALLTLTREDRQLCDRRYHGRWSVARLAEHAGVRQPAMRKRLQRVRDRLRKEMEVIEQQSTRLDETGTALPAKIVELLARPTLTDLPENPVGKALEAMRGVYADFVDVDLPEIVDLAAADEIGRLAVYVEPSELHRLDARRILRYDLTLPLLLTVRYGGEPLRVWSAGKCYRACHSDTQHLEAFHQAEVFWLDERERIDRGRVAGMVLESVERLLPGSTVRIVPTRYPMCTQAWELEVERDGSPSEVLAWGFFKDEIVAHVGGDPERHAAVGVGCGLERLAMLRYGIDDIRKIDVATVA